jgi:uncharacterized protein
MNNAENRWLNILEKEMNKAPSIDSSHDIHHIRRVWEHVKQIAKGMDVDWEVLIAATFLHDIGRYYPEGKEKHGPLSALFAEEVLQRINFPKEKIENTLLSIKYHQERFPSSKRTTIESKVLHDADKLDVFGAIGVSRYLIFHAMQNKTLKEIVDYALGNLPLRFKQLELEETKKVAESRFRYALEYFKQLKGEM